MRSALLLVLPLVLLVCVPARADLVKEKLWEAARKGDVKAVEELLSKGVDVNARTRYGATALWFAVYKGRADVVKLLLEKKADPDLPDTIWGATPLTLASGQSDLTILERLLGAKAQGADPILLRAALAGQEKLLGAVLKKHTPSAEVRGAALALARTEAVKEQLKKAGAKPLPAATAEQEKAWKVLEGRYQNPNGMPLRLSVRDGVLLAGNPALGQMVLKPAGDNAFGVIGHEKVRLAFESKAGKGPRLTLRDGTTESVFERAEATKPVELKPGPFKDVPGVVRSAANWPQFRGVGASGVADGQHPPAVWDATKPTAGMWKMELPGLGHSCPVIWGERVFITTAVSSDPKSEFKPGQYGAITEAKDRTKHVWKVYCLELRTGKVVWERTACEGVPKVRRHLKASHANATPVTDGKRLVVSFASEGLYCYDTDGKQLWKQDLGKLDPGMFSDPDVQWEAGSSPVLHKDLVIMQCDRAKDSFLAAYRLGDGKPAWKVSRDEPPSWGTPTVVESKTGAELVVNGTHAIRGYDPATGKELWQLRRNSQITVPTPIVGDGLIFVTSGYRPIQPIYAVWPGARGDITPKEGEESSDQLAWSKVRGGPYMPTPIYYRGHLYVCSNGGRVSCYEGKTGKLVYQQNLGGRDGYTASPVAADGRLYFTGEDGRVSVVQAGPEFKLLAVNDLADVCLATPAISNGTIVFRTQNYVIGVGRAE